MSAPGSEPQAAKLPYLISAVGLFLLLAPALTLWSDVFARSVLGTPFPLGLVVAVADIALILLLSGLYVRARNRSDHPA